MLISSRRLEKRFTGLKERPKEVRERKSEQYLKGSVQLVHLSELVSFGEIQLRSHCQITGILLQGPVQSIQSLAHNTHTHLNKWTDTEVCILEQRHCWFTAEITAGSARSLRHLLLPRTTKEREMEVMMQRWEQWSSLPHWQRDRQRELIKRQYVNVCEFTPNNTELSGVKAWLAKL